MCLGRGDFKAGAFWDMVQRLSVKKESDMEINQMTEKAELPEYLERGLAALKDANML